MKINPHKKIEYPCFYKLKTRWKDNDVYGHINNVIYYEYFDTAVNLWLIENSLLKKAFDDLPMDLKNAMKIASSRIKSFHENSYRINEWDLYGWCGCFPD